MTTATNGRPPQERRAGRAPTIYDIARETGLHASTVSRALHGSGRMSERTATRIVDTAEAMGYRVNPAARALLTGRTRTLALIVADITNPMVFGAIRGAERAAAEQGSTLVVAESQESAIREREVLDRVIPAVDGVILATSRLDDAAIRELAERVPVVLVNRLVDGVPSVVQAQDEGAVELVDHLATLQHEHIVHLGGPSSSWIGERRWRALEGRAAALGIVAERLGPFPPTRQGGVVAVEPLLCSGATAAVAFNDLMAIGVLDGLVAAGRSVPGDISLAGFDDIFGSDFTTPALTTVRAPVAELGAAAISALVAVVDAAVDPIVVSPTQLVVRDSTGIAAVGGAR